MAQRIGMPTSGQKSIIAWLGALLDNDLPFLVWDTETTGFGSKSQVIQIGIVDSNGEAVLSELIKPSVSIPAEATAVHGITDADVKDAPTIVEIYDELKYLFETHHMVAYNHAFDWRLLGQTLEAFNLPPIKAMGTNCFMLKYAEFAGEYSYRNGRRMSGYKWQALQNAAKQQGVKWDRGNHDATEDAVMTLNIMKAIWEANK